MQRSAIQGKPFDANRSRIPLTLHPGYASERPSSGGRAVCNRIHGLIVAHTNDAIDLAENPDLMLNQALRGVDRTIRAARSDGARDGRREATLAAQLQHQRRAARGLRAEAERAVAAGRRDLATRALGRKAEHEHAEGEIEAAWKEPHDGCAKHKSRLDQLTTRRRDLCRQRDTLVARQRTAEVRRRTQWLPG